MLSESDVASSFEPSPNCISKTPMAEQANNLSNSSEEIASVVSKIETLKSSGQATLSAGDYEAAAEHFSSALQLMYFVSCKSHFQDRKNEHPQLAHFPCPSVLGIWQCIATDSHPEKFG